VTRVRENGVELQQLPWSLGLMIYASGILRLCRCGIASDEGYLKSWKDATMCPGSFCQAAKIELV
jgi:hypothetical protein